MYAQIYPIPQKLISWLLVTDGSQMHVYDCRQAEKTIPLSGSSKHAYQTQKLEWELEPLPDMSLLSEPAKNYQIGHNRRGSVFGPAVSARHTVEPHLNIKDEIKHQLVHAAAAILRQAYTKKRFNRLIITAPPKMLGELREYLDPRVMKLVIAELPKDLTHCSRQELLVHIQDILSPIKASATVARKSE